MARAYFNCTCGERIAVYGSNRRQADSLATWHENQGHLCADCEQAAFAADNAANAEANAAAGLPALTGTEKQIAWAETIRADKLQIITAARDGRLSPMELAARWGDADPADPGLPVILTALQSQTAAHWWIDRRDRRAVDLLAEVAAQARPVPASDRTDLATAALVEATIRPPTEITPTIAEIRAIGERIEIVFPEKRDDFRQLVRFELGYAWNGSAWGRVISARSGPLTERLVEAGHRLLSAGFAVRIQDAELRQRAIAGDYQPERKRWITGYTSGTYQGWLCVQWPRDDDGIYPSAKRLPGARYDKPAVAVPASSYDAIEDFADAYGFAISDTARGYLDAARQVHDAAVIASPARGPAREVQDGDALPVATGEIDPELMDD